LTAYLLLQSPDRDRCICFLDTFLPVAVLSYKLDPPFIGLNSILYKPEKILYKFTIMNISMHLN
ncbi:MAG TPA: hypothetical protein PL110_11145, partial [Candidatus Eremiobacteraeota bacterium]|nr:hypothetical protein [Candidatus Eremiobacteraeota bacterium]